MLRDRARHGPARRGAWPRPLRNPAAQPAHGKRVPVCARRSPVRRWPEGATRQRPVPQGPADGSGAARSGKVLDSSGEGPRAGQVCGSRPRFLRRGNRPWALRRRARQGSPDHRQGLRQHRPHHPGAGARHRLCANRRRPARRRCRRRHPRRGRHQGLRLGRGDLRQPRRRRLG